MIDYAKKNEYNKRIKINKNNKYSSASEFVTLTVPNRTVPYRTEPYFFFWSVPFQWVTVYRTVPFFIFFRKARAQPLEAVNITVFWVKSVNRTVAI